MLRLAAWKRLRMVLAAIGAAQSRCRRACRTAAAVAASAISRSHSSRRSRQMWSIIGCSAVAQESTRAIAGSSSKPLRQLNHELHAGREPRDILAVGDLPAPGGVAARERDAGRDGAAVEHEPVDAGTSVGGERRDCRLHETADRRVVGCGGSGEALPAARLDDQEVLERVGDIGRGVRRHESHRPHVLEPSALAAQFLAPAGGYGALDIVLPVRCRARAGRAGGAEHGVTSGCCAPRRVSSADANGPAAGTSGISRTGGIGVVAGQMIEPCCDDSRPRHRDRPEGCRAARIGMRPSDEPRKRSAFDPGGKQPHQPSGRRPDQRRAGAGAENGRRGEHEFGRVEHVRLERARGEALPIVDDGFECVEPAPFHPQRWGSGGRAF